jgi:uncharacterized surface protein with fasciclin (FAS1) repeats
MKNFALLALVVLFSAPFVATGQDDNSTDVECSSITDILCTPGAGLKAICEAIEISELNDDLAEDSWTIFAPTDEAFMALGRENLDSLVFGNDTVPLTDLLLFHVFPGVGLTSDLLPCEAGNNLLEMANGKDSRTLCTKGVTPIEQRGQYNDKQDAPKFMETDILACNGVVSSNACPCACVKKEALSRGEMHGMCRTGPKNSPNRVCCPCFCYLDPCFG